MVKINGDIHISGLIFKELLKRGYSLKGNTRVWNIADSKLWYLTPEQSKAYLELEDSAHYQKLIEKTEVKLIDQNVKEILDCVGKNPLNVVDLGCGDGRKGAQIVKRFKKTSKIRYCPIDISGYMVREAIKNFSKLKLGEVVGFQYNISDFENLENITPLLRFGEFKKSLFLLLGNTLGNFELTELLYQIRNSMKDEDSLLIGVGIEHPKWVQIAKTAKNDKKTDNFLIHIPLHLGLKSEDVKFGARFQHSRIEFYYTLLKDKAIKFQEKEVRFNKGDKIVVAIAYKHKKDDLTSILKMYFKDVRVFTSKDNSEALFLCIK